MSAPRILVSNDDGHLAEGLLALAEAMAPLGEVWVAAPDREQSAASHSLSLHRPLRIKQIRPRWYAIDGTPSDCSYLAINHLMKEGRPALMVSGINHGPNLADDVSYSGTVAAAIEASLLGVPAISFSLVSRAQVDFGPAARFARSLAAAVLEQPERRNLLINVDPRGRKYYWIGGSEYQHEDIPGSDCNAVLDDHVVSVTPLRLELTDLSLMNEIRRWKINGFQKFPADGQ